MKREILIFGTGGHAKVVFSILESTGNYDICGFFDQSGERTNFLGRPVYNSSLNSFHSGIVAIGDNWTRQKVVKEILKEVPLFEFINAVHPSSIIHPSVKIGHGNVISPGIIINIDSTIQDHCIINTGCQVDHDCHFGSFSSLAPGAILAGSVNIGKRTSVGLAANIIHNITIGSDTVVGAGATVVSSFGDNKVILGVPGKIKRERRSEDKYL